MDRNVDIVTLYRSGGGWCWYSDVKWDNYLFALVPFIIRRGRDQPDQRGGLKNVAISG